MTRLLERLLEHTPFHSHVHRHLHPTPPATAGFVDCRGQWHPWLEDGR